jgi:hypothetical protein
MNYTDVWKLLVYVVFIAAMIFSGLQLGNPTKARAEASCCTFGQDCNTKGAPRCCIPLGEADCSATQINYCKLRCT